MHLLRLTTLGLVCHCLAFVAPAQTFLRINQDATPFNWSKFNGVPLSSAEGNPPGSDGSIPVLIQNANPATVGQFQSVVSFGGLAAPTNTGGLTLGLSLGGNAVAIGLPVAKSGSAVTLVLRESFVGAPFFSRAASFQLGSIIPVPDVDVTGALLPATTLPADYWVAEPYSINNHTNANYYWSPHAGAVFAIQPGPVDIVWRRARPDVFSSGTPAGFIANETHYRDGANFYPLKKFQYIASGTPVKPPQLMFWTEGVFRPFGKPVEVPTARISAVKIVYNNNFKENADAEYVEVGQSRFGSATNSYQELRTLWYDDVRKALLAYNLEGRVFLELLGDTRPDGKSKQHLGFEIVDVIKKGNPGDVTTELGERLTAYPDGRDDSDLFPEPVKRTDFTESFYFTAPATAQGRRDLYATRETRNENDVVVHWLHEGVQGLRWPFRFVRYTQVWPANEAKYSHYVRPVVADADKAKLTAVQLPITDIPLIEYEDPTDRKRADLTDQFAFYTFLDATVPAHRTLLRFTSGNNFRFERVFSWLDMGLKTPAAVLAGSVATNLTRWNVAGPFAAHDIRNLAGFAAKLTAATDPVSADLKGRLSPATLAALAAYNPGTGSGAAALQAGLVADLGVILAGPHSIDPTTGSLAGSIWTPQASGNRAWSAIASSEDGTKLVATVNGGQIYTSTNSGVEWTPRESNRAWRSIASSADGTKLVATVQSSGGVGGHIYTSTDSGVSWLPRESIRSWLSVGSSADGSRLVAGLNFGPLYQSTDSGVTWTSRNSSRGWYSIASSADGMKWAAVDNFGPVFTGGKIYTSTDGGATWMARGTDQPWGSIASSADGTKLAAVVRNGQIYTSTDSGVTWIARESDRQWRSIASSADGTRLAAVVEGGQIYTSVDSGATWAAHDSNRAWLGVASSADGTKMAAIVNGGQIYTSVGANPVPAGSDPYQFNRAFLTASYPDDIFHGQGIVSTDTSLGPRVISQTVNVGDRIQAPNGELGGADGDAYLAGHLNVAVGNSYHPKAYKDPLIDGFEAANLGAIIPVNAIPGTNTLEVWWFRKNNVDLSQGFHNTYWPSVIGRYTVQWPANPSEIVLASNDGSGGLGSLEAKGSIYTQNDPALPGYNPNEEHALMLGGQAYALRDDLNLTGATVPAVLAGAGATYSSDPFVLLDFTGSDGRPQMTAFKVLREKPEAGILFDYITEAGKLLQAPMPLPFLAKPVEIQTNVFNPLPGISLTNYAAVNYNREPAGNAGDLPPGWNAASDGSGPDGHYQGFTYRDRKNSFWVYRGAHAGLPALAAGTYNAATDAFAPLANAAAVVGQPFTNHVHVSRQIETLVMTNLTALPEGLGIEGLKLTGIPASAGTNSISLRITDAGDGSVVTNSFTLAVRNSGSVSQQGPLVILSTNGFTGTVTTFVGRPPFLAKSAAPTNSFTMRFYYKTEKGFAWPGLTAPPAEGAIVPYLRPLDGAGDPMGAPGDKTTPALDIVYRPTWPGFAPTLNPGQTLTVPAFGLPAVRGQSSLQVLYQQSIGTDFTTKTPSVLLHDPTREKSYVFGAPGLEKLPAGVRIESLRGKQYFPNLPPHLAERVFFDGNRGTKGHLVFKGEFKDELLGEKYVLLNVLGNSDLATVKALCPATDADKGKWDAAIDGLTATVETFYENPAVPGAYIVNPNLTRRVGATSLVGITDDDTAKDSYALSAAGPGAGFVTLIAGNGAAFTPEGEPVSLHVLKVGGPLYLGEVKILPSANPLNELLTMQHTGDLAARTAEYEYDWRIAPPVDGFPLKVNGENPGMTGWTVLANDRDVPRYTLGGAGIQVLVDNYVTLRYRPKNPAHPRYDEWSAWTMPALAEGWIKRVLAGINPFNQRVTDLFNNTVNTDANILTSAGKRWEGDVALSLESINNYGLIEIYETVLRRGKDLSINSGINFGPANDALLLAAGYLSDLYMMHGNEAYADAANPTIGIGTKDSTYGEIATSLFAFRGQVPTLLSEELALLRGRDEFFQPGTQIAPVYNRLVWNYTRGIDAGEVIYALNYNILDQDGNGTIGAADAAKLYPQGHGDAYGHYLTALKGYYSLLMDTDFDWVPRIEAVNILGKPVSVDYQDERKFATAAAAVARAGRQIFDLTWRQDYQSGKGNGWQSFVPTRSGPTRTRYWGMDHWASRTGLGAYANWVVGNAILPAVDPDPSHEGIQKVDRTTVPELQELPTVLDGLQTSLDNAEAGLTPLGLPETSIPFDLNPNTIVGSSPQTHFDQINERTKGTLRNALVAFDEAKDVTRLMRSEGDSLDGFKDGVKRQELTFTNALIELYGTPYPEDVGPGKTYPSGYAGPDFFHHAYVDDVRLQQLRDVDPAAGLDFKISLVARAGSGLNDEKTRFFDNESLLDSYTVHLDSSGYYSKPPSYVGRRASPGKLQEAVVKVLLANNAIRAALEDNRSIQYLLKREVEYFEAKVAKDESEADKLRTVATAKDVLESLVFAGEMAVGINNTFLGGVEATANAALEAIPQSTILGVANGGDLLSAAGGAIYAAYGVAKVEASVFNFAKNFLMGSATLAQSIYEREQEVEFYKPLRRSEEDRGRVVELERRVEELRRSFFVVNQRLQEMDSARKAYATLLAEGDRILAEREIFRQRSAAVIQGFRTRDAAFRIFRNEKLERYKTLFDLAARYAFMAAQAYDYETGQLGTAAGKDFVSRIIRSRALGVVKDGEPQYAGSNTGDPGLSSALAEMAADWLVLKGRLGFNNPDAYGTTASLRTENHRILPGIDGDTNWKDVLQGGRKANLLDDADVRRQCLQIDNGSGLPVPGIVLEFSTTVAEGHNLFGKTLAGGDHYFNPTAFATKLFAAGIALEGYVGMDDPTANSSAVGGAGGTSPSDPSASFLNANALAATPFIYLIPVGVDAMRSPPLGDVSTVRTWLVDDVTIPLPFNLGASDFSTKKLWLSGDSLTESLFGTRKHQAFRPVSTAAAFSNSIYTEGGGLRRSQFTNSRLVGRSAWNSKWKIVIPGHRLSGNADEGLDRFIRTVKDVKLHFVTYSYSGN